MKNDIKNKLNDDEKIWLEEKLYALNKLAKEKRDIEMYGTTYSYDYGKDMSDEAIEAQKTKKEYYDLKNKLIDKYGTYTGRIHKMGNGYGMEFSIQGIGSFHLYFSNYDGGIGKCESYLESHSKNYAERLKNIQENYNTIYNELKAERNRIVDEATKEGFKFRNEDAKKDFYKGLYDNEYLYTFESKEKSRAEIKEKNDKWYKKFVDIKDDYEKKYNKNKQKITELQREYGLTEDKIKPLGFISSENTRNITLTEKDIEQLKLWAEK